MLIKARGGLGGGGAGVTEAGKRVGGMLRAFNSVLVIAWACGRRVLMVVIGWAFAGR